MIGDASLENGRLILVGTAIWSKGGKSASFVSPAYLDFEEPTTESTPMWRMMLPNPEPPEPFAHSVPAYSFDAPEPNWNIELSNDPRATF